MRSPRAAAEPAEDLVRPCQTCGLRDHNRTLLTAPWTSLTALLHPSLAGVLLPLLLLPLLLLPLQKLPAYMLSGISVPGRRVRRMPMQPSRCQPALLHLGLRVHEHLPQQVLVPRGVILVPCVELFSVFVRGLPKLHIAGRVCRCCLLRRTLELGSPGCSESKRISWRSDLVCPDTIKYPHWIRAGQVATRRVTGQVLCVRTVRTG